MIERKDIEYPLWQELFQTETHHNHEIEQSESGKYFWKPAPLIQKQVQKIGLNEIVDFLYLMGFGRNSEVMRSLMRNIGYSIHGYWEIFYCETNNPNAPNYQKKK
jgi:hypothetical protein